MTAPHVSGHALVGFVIPVTAFPANTYRLLVEGSQDSRVKRVDLGLFEAAVAGQERLGPDVPLQLLLNLWAEGFGDGVFGDLRWVECHLHVRIPAVSPGHKIAVDVLTARVKVTCMDQDGWASLGFQSLMIWSTVYWLAKPPSAMCEIPKGLVNQADSWADSPAFLIASHMV